MVEFNIKEKLTEEQMVIYEDLLAQSKVIYPDFPDEVLQMPIVYYILSGYDEDCFQKLQPKNKSNPKYRDTSNYEYEESV